jgi:hypothetical protein
MAVGALSFKYFYKQQTIHIHIIFYPYFNQFILTVNTYNVALYLENK